MICYTCILFIYIIIIYHRNILYDKFIIYILTILDVDLGTLADSPSLSVINNPERKQKQAGRHKGQFEYATGVAKKRKLPPKSSNSSTSKSSKQSRPEKEKLETSE